MDPLHYTQKCLATGQDGVQTKAAISDDYSQESADLRGSQRGARSGALHPAAKCKPRLLPLSPSIGHLF